MRRRFRLVKGEEALGSGGGMLIRCGGGVGFFDVEFQSLEEKNVGGVEAAFLVVPPDWAFELSIGLDGVDAQFIVFSPKAVGGAVVTGALRCVGRVLDWGVAG